jgi:hypothetical protein
MFYIEIVIIIIDDGTGLLECVKFFDSDLSTPLNDIYLGALTSICGVITYKNELILFEILIIFILLY